MGHPHTSSHAASVPAPNEYAHVCSLLADHILPPRSHAAIIHFISSLRSSPIDLSAPSVIALAHSVGLDLHVVPRGAMEGPEVLCDECGIGRRESLCIFDPPRCRNWSCSRGGPPCYGGSPQAYCACEEGACIPSINLGPITVNVRPTSSAPSEPRSRDSNSPPLSGHSNRLRGGGDRNQDPGGPSDSGPPAAPGRPAEPEAEAERTEHIDRPPLGARETDGSPAAGSPDRGHDSDPGLRGMPLGVVGPLANDLLSHGGRAQHGYIARAAAGLASEPRLINDHRMEWPSWSRPELAPSDAEPANHPRLSSSDAELAALQRDADASGYPLLRDTVAALRATDAPDEGASCTTPAASTASASAFAAVNHGVVSVVGVSHTAACGSPGSSDAALAPLWSLPGTVRASDLYNAPEHEYILWGSVSAGQRNITSAEEWLDQNLTVLTLTDSPDSVFRRATLGTGWVVFGPFTSPYRNSAGLITEDSRFQPLWRSLRESRTPTVSPLLAPPCLRERWPTCRTCGPAKDSSKDGFHFL